MEDEEFAKTLQSEELTRSMIHQNGVKLKWMWRDARLLPGMGGLAQKDPFRWSDLKSAEKLADDLEKYKDTKRPVRMQTADGKSTWNHDDPAAAVAWLRGEALSAGSAASAD